MKEGKKLIWDNIPNSDLSKVQYSYSDTTLNSHNDQYGEVVKLVKDRPGSVKRIVEWFQKIKILMKIWTMDLVFTKRPTASLLKLASDQF